MKETPQLPEGFVIGRANEAVWKYTKRKYIEAHERLLAEMEESKDACGCKNCKHEIVRNFNKWTDWIAGDESDKYPHYRVNSNLKIEEYIPNDLDT